MSALLLAAFWVIVAAPPLRRPLAVVAAGALAGLAWEVKLFEATIAVPALVLLAWLALDLGSGDKLRTLAWAGVAYLASAAAWPVVASLLPGQHPFAMGSTNGQIWNALLVYNGIQRFGNHATSATPPGLLRLFTAGGARDFGALIGTELAAALAFGALAARPRGARRGGGPDDDDAPAPHRARLGPRRVARHRHARRQLHGPPVAPLPRGVHPRGPRRAGHRPRHHRPRGRARSRRQARPGDVRDRGRTRRPRGRRLRLERRSESRSGPP